MDLLSIDMYSQIVEINNALNTRRVEILPDDPDNNTHILDTPALDTSALGTLDDNANCMLCHIFCPCCF